MIPVFIGGTTVVDAGTLLAILDYSYFAEGANKEYLAKIQGEHRLIDATGGSRPKSLVITDRLLYLSAISPNFLKKRSDRLQQGICEIDCVEEG